MLMTDDNNDKGMPGCVMGFVTVLRLQLAIGNRLIELRHRLEARGHHIGIGFGSRVWD